MQILWHALAVTAGSWRTERVLLRFLAITALPNSNRRSPGLLCNLNPGGFLPVEIRVIAEEDEALQSIGLEEHFARYLL